MHATVAPLNQCHVSRDLHVKLNSFHKANDLSAHQLGARVATMAGSFLTRDLALDAFVEARYADDHPLVDAVADHLDLVARLHPELMVRPSTCKTVAVAFTRNPTGVAATWLTSR